MVFLGRRLMTGTAVPLTLSLQLFGPLFLFLLYFVFIASNLFLLVFLGGSLATFYFNLALVFALHLQRLERLKDLDSQDSVLENDTPFSGLQRILCLAMGLENDECESSCAVTLIVRQIYVLDAAVLVESSQHTLTSQRKVEVVDEELGEGLETLVPRRVRRLLLGHLVV